VDPTDQSNQPDTTFAYDGWSRMNQVSIPGSPTTTDTLDPLGRVPSRTVGGISTSYVYLGLTEDPVQVGVGQGASNLSWTPSGPLGISDANGTRIFLRDVHGDALGELKLAGSPQDPPAPRLVLTVRRARAPGDGRRPDRSR